MKNMFSSSKLLGLLFALFFISLLSNAQIADSSKREVKLQGAVNFRDLGGYVTQSGKHVKWGKIYRSAALNNLTDADLEKLQQLSIAKVIDFRGPYEIKSAPDKIPAHAKGINLPAGSENVGDSNYMKNMLKSMKNDSAILTFYNNITPFGDRYRPMFEQLLGTNKDSSLLFHCTAGKDRTGIAAALILSALGVDQKTILEDYAATNYYRRNENVKAIKGMVMMYKLDEEVATNMMAARESYLLSTFNVINAQYGSMENYLEKVMGLDKTKRKALQAKFLD